MIIIFLFIGSYFMTSALEVLGQYLE